MTKQCLGEPIPLSPGWRAGGEWQVERMRLSWEILDAFRAAS